MRTRMMVAVALGVLWSCSGDKRASDPKTRPTPEPSGPTAAAVDARTSLGGIEVASAPAAGMVPLESVALTIVATPTGIILDGKAVVAIGEGRVDPAELEGGALGMKVPKLTQMVSSLRQISGKDQPVVLVLDRRLPALVLSQIVYSAKLAGPRTFAIAALGDGKDMMVPIVLPDVDHSAIAADLAGAQRGGPDANLGPPMPVQPVVSIDDKGHVTLWSISGVFGTLQHPQLVIDDAAAAPAALAKELAALVAKRWPPGSTRGEPERRIIVMASSATPVATVIPIMSAVRADASGTELFPAVVLAAGFE